MENYNVKNVILITIDSLRADHLSCLGYSRETTPQLDELSKHGILFTNAISNGSSTPASFRPLLTSTPLSMYDDDRYISRDRVTIQEVLKKEGYQTAAYHSNPYLSSFLGYNRAFDTFIEILGLEKDLMLSGINAEGLSHKIQNFIFKSRLIKFRLGKLYKFSKGEPFARANTINGMATSWLKEKPDKFYIWLHYMDVHTPYIPKKKYLKLFSTSSYNIFKELKLYLKIKKTMGNKNIKKITENDMELLIDSYDAEIRYLDTQIGLLFDDLRNMDIFQNTLIIITSDHGEEFFEHGSFGHANEHSYDELIRVPLIIYAPWIGENIIINDPVELMSIAPTIIDALGLGEINEFMGKSLIPTIKEGKGGTEGIIIESSRNKIAYRDSEWKFIFNKESQKGEIYNLKDDPNEQNNIAELEIEKVKEYKKKILSYELMVVREKTRKRIKKLKVIKKV